jgi:hypothetical protein
MSEYLFSSLIMTKIKAIGLATNVDDRVRNWEDGVKAAGIPYKLLGVGQKFTGWKMRSELYSKELKDDTDTDIFIISDIYDVLVNPKTVKKIKDVGYSVKDYIVSTFQSFEKPIVVGAEKVCSHNCYHFSFSSVISSIFGNKHQYSNAGLVIGYREPLIALYSHLAKFPNDQIEMGKLVSEYPDIFVLDTHSKLFYNFFVNPDNERLNSALFVHFPGQNFSIVARKGYNKLANTHISTTTQASQVVNFTIILVLIMVCLALVYLHSHMYEK